VLINRYYGTDRFHSWKKFLRSETRQKTFPYVYIKGKFEGGYASLQNLIRETNSILYQISPIADQLLKRGPIEEQIDQENSRVQL
jgi:hypothetical protein